MTPEDEIILIGYLEDALDAPHGIKLFLETSEELRALRQRLYKLRAEDARYEDIQLSEFDKQLWLVKKHD